MHCANYIMKMFNISFLLCHSVLIHILVISIPSYVITEPEIPLRVSIPNEVPLRPLMGDTLVLPCYFLDNTVNDPGAPTIAPLSHRIKWSLVTKEKTTNILVASEGLVNIDRSYLDRVTMLGYPMTPTDASIKITELHSNDSGVYRCEVMHGIEDSHDTVDVQVQGTACVKILTKQTIMTGCVCFFCQKCEMDVLLFLRYCFPLSCNHHAIHPYFREGQGSLYSKQCSDCHSRATPSSL